MDGSPALQGTVLGIAKGITDQDNKDGPELLSSVNPTYTWVRLAQRIPVRVRLTHVPPGVLVSAGIAARNRILAIIAYLKSIQLE
jgi:multidrug resistance efflux pump